jgi:hypothetical protein
MRQRARPFIANLFLSIGEMLYLSSITFSHLLTWSLVHERGSPGRWLCDELVWSADASIKSKVIPIHQSTRTNHELNARFSYRFQLPKKIKQ